MASKERKDMVMLNIFLPPNVLEEIRGIAEEKGLAVSAYIRTVLLEKLESIKNEKGD